MHHRRATISITTLLTLVALPFMARAEVQAQLTFTLGDVMSAAIERLEEGVLSIRPAVSPEMEMKIQLKSVTQIAIRRDAPAAAARAAASELQLRDGSLLRGRLVSIAKDSLRFEDLDLGRIDIPLREGVILGSIGGLAAGADQYTVETNRGDRISGSIGVEGEDRLRVSSPSVSAAVPLAAISAIGFPETREELAPSAAGQDQVLVRLVGGSTVLGITPRIIKEKLSIRTSWGTGIEVAVASIETIDTSPSEGGFRRGVLVWGAYGDPEEEHLKAMTVVKREFGAAASESKSREFGAEFTTTLRRVRTLLITEMERYDKTTGDRFADAFRPEAERFLKSGGRMVFLALQTDSSFLKRALAFPIRVRSGSEGARVAFAREGAALGRGLGEGYTTANATNYYESSDGWTTLAATESGLANVVGRRVGAGWVIVIGLDFYSTNAQTEQLLANALRL